MNSAGAQLRVSAARTVHQIFQGRSLKAVLAEERSAFADGRDRALLEAMTLGTVRHRREKDIGALNTLQWRLLKNAWRHLRPGGRLLYSTCSVLKAENEILIGQFLQQHADARPCPWMPASVASAVPAGNGFPAKMAAMDFITRCCIRFDQGRFGKQSGPLSGVVAAIYADPVHNHGDIAPPDPCHRAGRDA